MLILFDVDATLITTSRTGIHAMGRAGRDLFGPDFDELTVEYAGRLDPLIITDLLSAHGQPAGPGDIQRFRDTYRHHLETLLADNGLARPCPGVPELLAAIEALGIHIGLLTGNFPETGRIKLLAASIDPERFHIHVWGSDSPHHPPARDHLPPIGLDRYHERFSVRLDPADVIIIGDTPHDVACAHAHGCRAIATATGRYSFDELTAAGADLVVDNLAETERIVQWITRTETTST